MTVVSDASPLHYLVLIGREFILPQPFEEIGITQTVADELQHPHAPLALKTWMKNPPKWITIWPDSVISDDTLAALDPGERTTIHLAEHLPAAIVLLDELAARTVAVQRSLKIAGTLGILRDAAHCGLIQLTPALDRLRATSFRASPELWRSLYIQEPK